MDEKTRIKIWEGFDHMAKYYGYNERDLQIARQSYYCGLNNMLNIQYDEKKEAEKTSQWYCDMCKKVVPNEHVTYEETHDPRFGGCGQALS